MLVVGPANSNPTSSQDPTSLTNSYTVDDALDPGTNYTWGVDALDVNGHGVGTTTFAFTFTADETPVLLPSELCADNPGGAIATFEDANLEAAVRAAVGVGAADDLTCDLLSGLTSLTASDAGITSLVGIQNLSSLTSLYLSRNTVTDISALSGLTSLKTLALDGGNSISDISALSGLTSLTSLFLNHNSITDISAVNGLTSLTLLALGNNPISDFSALSGLTSLTNLTLFNTSISDVSALSGLTSLTTLLLFNNSISDISPLSGLTSLTRLELDNNSINDISLLSGLTSLTELGLRVNLINNITPLSGLTSLMDVELDYNSISDVSALSGLTSLTRLLLNNNPDLANIQALLDNTGLGSGDEVFLSSTNVSCTDVARLRAKGVEVSFNPCAPLTNAILIDASKDGGGWWFPQPDGNFDPSEPHQGKDLADYLQSQGNLVVEVGRGVEITDGLLSSFTQVIRVGVFGGAYTGSELAAYDEYILRSDAHLLLTTAFLSGGAVDAISEGIGLPLEGSHSGVMSPVGTTAITQGVGPLNFVSGAAVGPTPTATITTLGTLEDGSVVMGLVTSQPSKILFLGSLLLLEGLHNPQGLKQPLVANLLSWLFS